MNATIRQLYERKSVRDDEDWMQAFCSRKDNLDFSVEMSRSVEKDLRNFLEKEE